MNFKEVVEALHAGHVPPKPLNGKGQRYSASTAKKVDVEAGGCERRHWFSEVVGIEEPISGPALAIGTKVHGHLERALKTGVELRVDPSASMEERLAAKGLPHLPPYGTPGMHIEESFKMSTWPGGPEFTGTADLYLEPEGWSNVVAHDTEDETVFESAELHDHKTTGSYHRYAAMGWALSEDKRRGDGNAARKFLSDDVQNIAYATRLLRKFPIKRVESIWGYFQKDGGPHLPIRATMERDETLEKWRSKVLPLLEVMQHQHQQRPSLSTVPANLNACDSFKGCPHRSYCSDYKEGKTMGKLSEQITKGHSNIKAETKKEEKKETKTEAAPAINPPALAKSPFATMDAKKDLPKKQAEATHEEEQNEKAKTAKAHQDKEPAHQEKTQTTAAPTGAGFALFLACDPFISKRPEVSFAKVVAPLEERIAKAKKVAHIGLIQYDAAHLLCAALADWYADNGSEWDGCNVVVGKSAFHLDVAERVLLSKAVAAARGAA